MAMLTAAVVRCHPPMATIASAGRAGATARSAAADAPYVPWMIALPNALFVEERDRRRSVWAIAFAMLHTTI
tara:strand:- start:75 stop:290 length:216 start_codon:yes stop_codon:yes gene_type:complete